MPSRGARAAAALWETDSSSEGWEDLNPKQTAKAREARTLRRWTLLLRRIFYAFTVSNMWKVLKTWQKVSLEDGTPEATLHEDKTKKKAPPAAPKPRRDDLCYVGAPMAPTSRPYGIPRATCTHESPEKKSLLSACGGRAGVTVIYWWTCSGCGSRWNRVSEEQALNPKVQTSSSSSSRRIEPKPHRRR